MRAKFNYYFIATKLGIHVGLVFSRAKCQVLFAVTWATHTHCISKDFHLDIDYNNRLSTTTQFANFSIKLSICQLSQWDSDLIFHVNKLFNLLPPSEGITLKQNGSYIKHESYKYKICL